MPFSLKSVPLVPVLLFGLAACDPAAFAALNGAAPNTVSEEVRAAAAPNQNIESARVLPEDGCYWYEYAGPVESTLLPLRAPNGAHLCTAAAVAEATDTTAG